MHRLNPLTIVNPAEHAAVHTAISARNERYSERRLQHMSDELLAAILSASDAPGVMYRLLQANHARFALVRCEKCLLTFHTSVQVNIHLSNLLADESWPTWRSLAHRMSTWVPLIQHKDGDYVSGIATSMLTKAAGEWALPLWHPTCALSCGVCNAIHPLGPCSSYRGMACSLPREGRLRPSSPSSP